ncbi:Tryptophan synthase beta subunit-like PLP-dependent enzyme, partial [Russula decolorans]
MSTGPIDRLASESHGEDKLEALTLVTGKVTLLFDDHHSQPRHCKALFADRPFNEKYHLGAVNSINWARILAYFQVRKQIPHPENSQIQFVVPTGNFGDVLAGYYYYAKRMGLPMGKLVVATNSNDTVDLTPGGDGKPADGGVQATLSPGNGHPCTYLAYESSNPTLDSARRASAGATIDGWMKSVKTSERVEAPVKVLELARRDFLAGRVSDDQTLQTIKQYFSRNPSYIADPHTAVALTVARRVSTQNPPSVVQVLSTAHPAKFSEAVTKA